MSFEHLVPYLDKGGICPDPIFVIGSPRSGTTGLAHALGRHPALRVGRESYLLHDLFRDRRIEEMWARHNKRATFCWLVEEKVERDELLAFIGLGVNALFSSRSKGKRWIDPTPLYTPMAETIAAMFPGAFFLHIVRDGRGVVRSMMNFERMLSDEKLAAAQPHEIPSWSRDFRKACETWTTWVDAGLDLAERHPTRCLTVHNEQLSTDPMESFADILTFLGAEQDPAPATKFAKKRINSSWRNEPSRPSEDDWSEWTLARRKEFAAVAGETMARAGYGDRRSLEEWARG